MYYYYYIYKITNTLNNKCYIGKHKAKNLNNSYLGSGLIIKNAINKYGIQFFKKEILEITNEINTNDREKYWILFYNSKYPNGYNIEDGGEGGDFITNHPNKKEILQKMKNRKPWNKGKKMPESFKQRCRESFYMNETRRKNMSNSHLGQIAWNKGKKMSNEQKIKLSKSHKGHTPWNKGKKLTDKQKQNQHKFSSGNIPWNKGIHGVIKSPKKGIKTDLHWFTNGEISVCCKNCPDGFWKGRVIKKRGL